MGVAMALTFLAFHAHPDDEAILTGGTLARVAAAGHRVVLVTATDGALGLTSRRYAAAGLAGVRAAELAESARLLGVARVEQWGYADSGLGPVLFDDPPGQVRFSRASVDEAAERLAGLLREESVDVLLTYDANGGYGHPDHVQVHRVGVVAAELAQTPRVLEVAVSPRVARVMKPRHLSLAPVRPATVVVDVRDQLDIKIAAMRAHRSQLTADGWLPRNIDVITRLPRPVLARSLGWERFADPTGSSAPLCP
jgi:LmbE family N-acetylglucosaminyl deacetylase